MFMAEQRIQPTVLLFDVNETLLDLTPLADSINAVLLDEHAAKLWVTTMLQYSLVMTVSEQYAALPEIGAAVLQMMARNYEVVLTSEDAKKALEPMRTLPPHPDVLPGLQQLRQAGFRLSTLTNSSQSGIKSQLEHAGLADCFERQLSVESVGKYKPHRAVFQWAAREMQVEPGECMLVAAHGWDVAGAKWAGLQTAFIGRAGQQLFPLAPPPDVHAADVSDLAKRLCA